MSVLTSKGGNCEKCGRQHEEYVHHPNGGGLVHTQASVGMGARVGDGASVGMGASVGAWAIVGMEARVGERASVGAWAIVGKGVVLASSADILSGHSRGYYWTATRGILTFGCESHTWDDWRLNARTISQRHAPQDAEAFTRHILALITFADRELPPLPTPTQQPPQETPA